MAPRWRCENRLSWSAWIVLVLVCQITCCHGGLAGDTAKWTATGCTPREITGDELAVWIAERSSDGSGPEAGRQPQPPRSRRRRGLLVSDTDCSLDNLCHPTARPRVCYYNSDICNGVSDCDTGRDELYCEDCLCPYQTVPGVTMSVPDGRVRYWVGVNLKACARACNEIEAGCVAFSFSPLASDKDRCRIFFTLGRFIANNVGGTLYLRDAPSVPRLAPSAHDQSAPSVPQDVTAAVNCSSLDMHQCVCTKGRQCSNEQCLPFSQLCDGIQQCTGSNEEVLCGFFPSLYTRSPGKTLGSYSSPLPAPVSLGACAGYCFSHSTRHPKCLFFAYRGSTRECLIGCSSCGDAPGILDDPEADFYSVSLGGAAGLAAALIDLGASSNNANAAAPFEKLRPSLRQITESLKTLGVSVPVDTPDALASSLFAQITQTSPPTTATVLPTDSPRPFINGRPSNGRPQSFPIQGNSANSASRPSFSSNAGSAPSSSFGSSRPSFSSNAGSAPSSSFGSPRPSFSSNAGSAPSSSFFGSPAARPAPSQTPQLPPEALPQLPSDCGRRPLAARAATDRTQTRVILSSGSSNRVVRGERATYGTYPWQAQLQVYSERGHFEHHCGGALIGERLVLTAAHCLRPALNRLQVKLGQHDRRDPGEQHEQTFAVENALTHPGYRSDPARGDADDLAVLKLRLRQGQPVLFSSHVQPLCLPAGPPPPIGAECRISGWGKTDPQLPDSPDSAADVLHGAVVPLVSDSLCSAREVYGERFLPERMVCAGHLAGGPDTCQGDSGGPLACLAADGRWQLTGIVSFGEGCGGPLKPGVYTRVGYYASWIRRVVQLL